MTHQGDTITTLQALVADIEERAERSCSNDDCDWPASRRFQGKWYCSDCFIAVREIDDASQPPEGHYR